MAIISELKVEFEDGLNIITGETGAGKSLIIKAVQYLLGKKFSPEVLRTGSETLIIEGEFIKDKINFVNLSIIIYFFSTFLGILCFPLDSFTGVSLGAVQA